MEDRGCFFALVRLALVLALTLGLACDARLDEAYGVEFGARAVPRASDGLGRAAPVRIDGAPAGVAVREALLERLVLNSERSALARVARVVEVQQRGAQIDRQTWPASALMALRREQS